LTADPQNISMEFLERALGSQGRTRSIEHTDHLNAMLRDLDAQQRFCRDVIRLHTKRGEAAETAKALTVPANAMWIAALERLKGAHEDVAAAARDEARGLEDHPLVRLRRQLELIAPVHWSDIERVDLSCGQLTLTVRGDGLKAWLAANRHMVTEYEIDDETKDGVTTIIGARVEHLLRVVVYRGLYDPKAAKCPPDSPRLDRMVIA
jgi:hypothetical protein